MGKNAMRSNPNVCAKARELCTSASRVSIPYIVPWLRCLKNKSYTMKPKYDLPAPWSAKLKLVWPCASNSSNSFSINPNKWYTCLSLRRESWFKWPSRVKICKAFSSSMDCPGRMASCTCCANAAARGPVFLLMLYSPLLAVAWGQARTHSSGLTRVTMPSLFQPASPISCNSAMLRSGIASTSG